MDAYQILTSIDPLKAITENDFNSLLQEFQEKYLQSRNYYDRLTRHRKPHEIKQSLFYEICDYLQKIDCREEMRDIDIEKNSSGYVSVKIGEIWRSDNALKSCFSAIEAYCKLRSKDLNTIAVHVAEYRAMAKLASKIKRSMYRDNKRNNMPNKITTVTRRNIADELTTAKFLYSGRMRESDFLNRLYDLAKMPSTDHRAAYDDAYKDIRQHMDNNADWEPDWIFTDSRFNLMHTDDEAYLKFLAETLHPAVRPDDGDTDKILALYNKHLAADGYQLHPTGEISGKPLFGGIANGLSDNRLLGKKADIKKYLDTAYVNAKIELMNKTVRSETDVALGTGKELLETICKSILKQKGAQLDKDWTLPQLLKNTTAALDFTPKEADDPDKAEKSIKQILGGIASIVQGVTELRNAYGTGHGKDADFKGIESKYAQLFIGVVSEIAIIYLATNGETEIVNEAKGDDLPF